MYRWLPLGTIVNNRVLVVHGGVSDSTDLDLIRSLDRGKVKMTATTLFVFSYVRPPLEVAAAAVNRMHFTVAMQVPRKSLHVYR